MVKVSVVAGCLAGVVLWCVAGPGAAFVAVPTDGAVLQSQAGLRVSADALGARSGMPVGIAAAPGGHGFWVATDDGVVTPEGAAVFYGDLRGVALNQPVVGIAATPSGHGYWLVASDGGVFPFGDARFLGSTGAVRLNQPVVGMAATASGHGYWLVASDGGVFPFGDARFFGFDGGGAVESAGGGDGGDAVGARVLVGGVGWRGFSLW